MEFEFDGETLYHNSIDLDNIHQVCIKATDNQGFSYWLIIRTLLGECSCLDWGPLVDGDTLLPDSTSIRFERFESDDRRIQKKIKMFLSPKNQGKCKIVEVMEMDFNKALDEGINLLDYMRGFSKEGNY